MFLDKLREQDYAQAIETICADLGWDLDELEETFESLAAKTGLTFIPGMMIDGELCVVLPDPTFMDTQEGPALMVLTSCPEHDVN